MCNLKLDTSELIYKTETDPRQSMDLGVQGCGGRVEGPGGRGWEFRIHRSKLLYMCVTESLYHTSETV